MYEWQKLISASLRESVITGFAFPFPGGAELHHQWRVTVTNNKCKTFLKSNLGRPGREFSEMLSLGSDSARANCENLTLLRVGLATLWMELGKARAVQTESMLCLRPRRRLRKQNHGSGFCQETSLPHQPDCGEKDIGSEGLTETDRSLAPCWIQHFKI